MVPRRPRFAEGGLGMQATGIPRPLMCLAFVAASRPGLQPASRFPAPRRSPRAKAGAWGGGAGGREPPGERGPQAKAEACGGTAPRPAQPPARPPPSAPPYLEQPHRPSTCPGPGPGPASRARRAPWGSGPAQPLGGGRRAPVAVMAVARAGPPAAPLAERRLAALRAAGDKRVAMSRQGPCGLGGNGIRGCIGKSVSIGRWFLPPTRP